MDQEQIDREMMLRCIALARKAEGRTSPNPMVGAVVLDKDSNVVGEGFHPKAGMPHAEVFAFDEAKEKSIGGTLYVNLEPCSHFGRTPPCADRVIASGVTRVVVGMIDPNPKVAGSGIKKITESGIKVHYSELEKECQNLNRAFVKRINTGLPWLTLKMACTLDGRIADRTGKSRWISGAEARAFVHALRNTIDCVLIGGTTANADDPELNVRDLENSRDPHRAIIDPQLQISPGLRLFNSAKTDLLTAVFYDGSRAKSSERVRSLSSQVSSSNCKLVDLQTLPNEHSHLKNAMLWLAQNGIQSVLCEGGGRLAAALLKEKLVDEVCWILAPKFLADSEAKSVLASDTSVLIADAFELVDAEYTQLGRDIMVRGLVAVKE